MACLISINSLLISSRSSFTEAQPAGLENEATAKPSDAAATTTAEVAALGLAQTIKDPSYDTQD